MTKLITVIPKYANALSLLI